ncbi:EsaB/YukD family protein [Enterococcus rivorum]|uniref:Secretion accessory protein EsaB/YukD n=1 Tax=Enterococcus rivorum TaxID=762845 RepID=A0A1E5KWN3_9ENTE|nr:EsaB/YukD family protein [Enterococcus rivorum]MBP2099121.1 putative ubiquitin-like protein YukD [Enterococcus rivorum]OEH82271.1 secretion accessory protein EsaB/YukD [Enterococcus rivorum]
MAENKEHINITLLYQGNKDKSADLRIPRNISVYRFVREINQIFGRPKDLKKYQLKIINKGILLDEEKKLKQYPITDGDIIEVLEAQI